MKPIERFLKVLLALHIEKYYNMYKNGNIKTNIVDKHIIDNILIF